MSCKGENILTDIDLEEMKKELNYKRARLRAVWEKMDSWTREYDKLLREIDVLVYKIKKYEESWI